ncbi:MAG: hypothetical protein E5Y29_13480 [Mesorhizobium sp.]|nr:MAG: hypothetical protein E5Y29_13480 [Mesorhizobium sp.]
MKFSPLPSALPIKFASALFAEETALEVLEDSLAILIPLYLNTCHSAETHKQMKMPAKSATCKPESSWRKPIWVLFLHLLDWQKKHQYR